MAKTPELQRFYATKRWRDLRNMLVIDRHGICDRCGKDFSGDTSQLVAHHKEHLTDESLADPAVAVNPDNIEILCAKCHALQHRERGFIKKRKEVYIVYGSPLSGKSTYVRQNMEPGDLVVDLDGIRASLGYLPIYSPAPSLQKTAFAVRDFLYDQIRIRAGEWLTAWVIAGLPRKNERERLAARLGASLILVEATAEECRKRLYAADDGRYPDWGQYIDQWFRDYQP
jgi:hypothetical protein